MTRDDIISFVIGLEGGYVDDPNDPGGATNFGITQKRLEAAIAADATLPFNVSQLTQSQAAAIYRAGEWQAVGGDLLPGSLALLAFDTAVNEGAGRAIVTLQQALGVATDGILGPATINAARSAGVKACAEFTARRAVCYAQLNACEGTFELGWMRRLVTVYTRALTP